GRTGTAQSPFPDQCSAQGSLVCHWVVLTGRYDTVRWHRLRRRFTVHARSGVDPPGSLVCGDTAASECGGVTGSPAIAVFVNRQGARSQVALAGSVDDVAEHKGARRWISSLAQKTKRFARSSDAGSNSISP